MLDEHPKIYQRTSHLYYVNITCISYTMELENKKNKTWK